MIRVVPWKRCTSVRLRHQRDCAFGVARQLLPADPALFVVRGAACQVAIASSVNQTVKLPGCSHHRLAIGEGDSEEGANFQAEGVGFGPRRGGGNVKAFTDSVRLQGLPADSLLDLHGSRDRDCRFQPRDRKIRAKSTNDAAIDRSTAETITLQQPSAGIHPSIQMDAGVGFQGSLRLEPIIL